MGEEGGAPVRRLQPRCPPAAVADAVLVEVRESDGFVASEQGATVEVLGDGFTSLDERDVFFLVPPAPVEIPLG